MTIPPPPAPHTKTRVTHLCVAALAIQPLLHCFLGFQQHRHTVVQPGQTLGGVRCEDGVGSQGSVCSTCRKERERGEKEGGRAERAVVGASACVEAVNTRGICLSAQCVCAEGRGGG